MSPRYASILCLSLAAAVADGSRASAASSTECTVSQTCYCVDQDVKDAILTRVAEIRARIAEQRAQGKAVGYLSIPISTAAGGYLPINARVAMYTKERIEERLGVASAWLVNTASSAVTLPPAARGADYMLMWTKILEGDDGLGRDFDFVYFVGPADFARYFSLDGRGDLEKLEAYYDGLTKTDEELKKVDKRQFRNYYGLRASVTASLGSHDEWNIVRMINEKRRHDAHKSEFGIARQVAMLFEGNALPPGPTETSTASGNSGRCPQ